MVSDFRSTIIGTDSNSFSIGDGTDGYKYIYASISDSFVPGIRYNPNNNQWEYSSDGYDYDLIGNVFGPNAALDNSIVLFDSITGKLVKDSLVIIDGYGNITTPGTVNGRDLTVDGYDLDTHLSDFANPHVVTASQVGNTVAQWNANQIQGTSVDATDIEDGYVLKYNSISGNLEYQPDADTGAGDVFGPSGALDTSIAIYDGVTGKLITDSLVTIDGYGNIVTPGTINGRDAVIDGYVIDGFLAGDLPTGFENRTDSELIFSDVTREFTVQPKAPATEYLFWERGVKYVKDSADTVTIDDLAGRHYIYFLDGYLTSSQAPPPDFSYPLVTIVTWDGYKNIGVADERHGIVMDWKTHEYLHLTIGTRYSSGLSLSPLATGSGTIDGDAQVSVTSGTIYDEDINVDIVNVPVPTEYFEQNLGRPISLPGYIPVYYRFGPDGYWTNETATAFPMQPWDGVVGSRIGYNYFDSSNWINSDVNSNGDRVAVWIFATSSITDPVISVVGQRYDKNLNDAQDNNTFESLDFGTLPFQEIKVLYRVIIRTSLAYGNTIKAYIEDVTDYRSVSNLPGANYVPVAHSSLSGLTDANSHPASAISTVTTSFDIILSAADIDVQTALDTIDDHVQDETHGGTNQTTWAAGDVLYASGVDTLSKLTVGPDGYILKVSSGVPGWSEENGGGNVVGPASSLNTSIAIFDGVTGKLIQDSLVTIDGYGDITTSGTVDGRNISDDGYALDSHIADLSNPHIVTPAQVGNATAQWNADQIQGVTVDDTDISDGYVLKYNSTSGNLEYVSATEDESPVGFENGVDSDISFDDGTRTFTIQPKAPATSFKYWAENNLYEKDYADSITIPDTTGTHYFYYDGYDLITTTVTLAYNVPIVATVLWDGYKNVGLSDERHTIYMSWATHKYLHESIGTKYVSGLTGLRLSSGTGAADVDAQFTLTNGVIFDEDIEVDIVRNVTPSENFEQEIGSFPTTPGEFPVYYQDGYAVWTKDDATTFPMKQWDGYGRIGYSAQTSGYWTVEDPGENNYVAYWIVGTNNVEEPVLSLMGVRFDTRFEDADNNNSLQAMLYFILSSASVLPFREMKIFYRLIVRTSLTYANSIQGAIVDVKDYRNTSINVLDHSGLGGRDNANQHPATAISVDTSGFSSILSGSDDTSQKAFDTIDDHVQGVIKGGTGFTTYASGDLLYSDATNSLNKLTIGGDGYHLISNGTTPEWTSFPLFGSDYDYEESVSRSTTTSTTFQTKVTLTTPPLNGTHLVTWSASVDHSSRTTKMEARLRNTTDSTNVTPLVIHEPKDVVNRTPVTGVAEVVFSGPAKTFEIQYRAQTVDTAGIEGARIVIWKI